MRHQVLPHLRLTLLSVQVALCDNVKIATAAKLSPKADGTDSRFAATQLYYVVAWASCHKQRQDFFDIGRYVRGRRLAA